MGALDGVLAAARALGPDPTHDQLRALGAALPAVADEVDAPGLAAAMTGDRALLAGDDGPVVALRRYAPGESSTVHDHGWAVLHPLDADGTLERWDVGPGPARLRRLERLGPGGCATIRDGEGHRQPGTTGGGTELVVFAGHGARERTDHAAEPTDETTAALVRAYVDGFKAADAAAVAGLCAEDVRVDLNVPHGRVPLAGRDQLAMVLAAEEFGAGYRIVAWRADPTPSGAVVELDARFGGRGSRQLHTVETDGERINGITVFCTGIWAVQ